MGLFTKMQNAAARRADEGGEPVEAVWNGTVIAHSPSTVMVEGNHYFPPESVDWDRLVPHDHRSVCPWKGTASYYSIEVAGDRNEAAVWTYEDPKPEAAAIKDHLAFSGGVTVRPAGQDAA